MGSISIDLVALTGYILTVIIGLVAYRAGSRAGARTAHRAWENWMGLRLEELQNHKFDRELRSFRRDIGRPADAWSEEAKED